MIYAGFWRRALSLIIDAVIIIPPVIAIHVYVVPLSIKAAFLAYLLSGLLATAYPVVFHARWGQTIGKMVTGIRVIRLDGKPIHLREAFLRSSVDIIIWLFFIAGVTYMFLAWEGPPLNSMSYNDRVHLFSRLNPTEKIYRVAADVWTLSEIVVLLFNKKKRAVHDFIAGTVVIVCQSIGKGVRS